MTFAMASLETIKKNTASSHHLDTRTTDPDAIDHSPQWLSQSPPSTLTNKSSHLVKPECPETNCAESSHALSVRSCEQLYSLWRASMDDPHPVASSRTKGLLYLIGQPVGVGVWTRAAEKRSEPAHLVMSLNLIGLGDSMS